MAAPEASPDSGSSKELHDPNISGSASSESFMVGKLEWSPEATTASEEARTPSAACMSAMHTNDVIPEGINASASADAASEEAEGPATAGITPETGGVDNNVDCTLAGGSLTDSLLLDRFIRGAF